MQRPLSILLAALTGLAFTPGAHAQSNPVYVPMPPAKAALYKPDSGRPPHVAVLLMHRTANDLIVMPGAGNPGPGPGGSVYLNALDPGLSLNRTVREQKLLKNDGTVVRQVVSSVIAPDRIAVRTNRTFDTGTKLFSLRSFLSANAIRSTNSLDGIDHCSSNNSTVCAVKSISVPVMFAAMGAFVFIRDNEIHFEVAKSADRDFVVIEGANHGFAPCTECERQPGQYGNSMRNFYNYVRDWINARF